MSLVPFSGRELPGARLPTPLTSFIGREREIAPIAALLLREDVRLVTLTGPGGVGKTRLASRVAEEIAPHFSDGIWFVSLAPITDSAHVAPTIAQALGVHEASGEPIVSRIAALIEDRHYLLMLDNFEQVIEAAPVVIELLQHSPHLTAFVTSRGCRCT